jgi:hypothetical protein
MCNGNPLITRPELRNLFDLTCAMSDSIRLIPAWKMLSPMRDRREFVVSYVEQVNGLRQMFVCRFFGNCRKRDDCRNSRETDMFMRRRV